MRKLTLAAAVFAFAGCGTMIGRDSIERDVENTVRNNERAVIEARTLSGLARLESSVSDFIKHEGKIPPELEALIPKYLGELPAVEIGIPGHRDNTDVKVFPADVLRDGVLNGTKLTDSGKWGYVFNDRQVVVFVDCTHQSTKGRPWYLERGVY